MDTTSGASSIPDPCGPSLGAPLLPFVKVQALYFSSLSVLLIILTGGPKVPLVWVWCTTYVILVTQSNQDISHSYPPSFLTKGSAFSLAVEMTTNSTRASLALGQRFLASA